MITGDHPETAAAIARDAGLDARQLISGEALDRMTAADLASQIGTADVFARIMPEQKLRIVNALKANGEIVAMTGDGVNDAPSLKAAHIGVAMGGRGTDVAREASAIVLLDDDFGSIVKAVRLGRRIYDNLRKATAFILAVHVPIAGLALAPLVFGLPVLFGPIHIAFIEMVIDPVCSLVFAAAAAPASRTDRAGGSRRLEPVPGPVRHGDRGRRSLCRAPAGHAAGRDARPYVFCAHPYDRRAHSRQSRPQRFGADGAQAPKPGSPLDSGGGRGDSDVDARLAVCSGTLPVWAAAPRRSGVDGRIRRCRVRLSRVDQAHAAAI